MPTAILFDKGNVSVAEFTPREILDNEVLIESEYTCISPGTELRCLRGKQENMPDKPYVPGYTLTGTVVKSRSKMFPEGARVSTLGSKDAGELAIAWGGHLSHGIADADALLEIPRKVAFLEASFAVLGSIAYHGFRQAKPRKNEKAAVIGLGVIGQLCARIWAAKGASLAACDKSRPRVDLASKAGIKSVLCTGTASEALRSVFPDGVTLLVDSTGIPQVIDDAIGALSDIPWNNSAQTPIRYVIQGSYEGDFSINYNRAFRKQVSFIIPRAQQKRDRAAFLKMLSDGSVSVTDLATRIEKPENAADAYEALKTPDKAPGTIAFKWK